MSLSKFKECHTCYYRDREPAICEDCFQASEYEPADLDDELIVKFHSRTPENDE